MTDRIFPWEYMNARLDSARLIQGVGRIRRVTGLMIESVGPEVSLGEVCYIHERSGKRVMAEVVGFNDELVIMMPYGPIVGIAPGAKVTSTGRCLQVKVGEQVLGRVLDPLCNPMDGGNEIMTTEMYDVDRDPPNPISRPRIHDILPLGVRVLDGCITCGTGQRVGVFAGSGVGKSTLMGMIARNTEADINVISLVGERGREVREFVERDLGEEGLKRSVVIVATSSEPAILRLKGAFVATAMAEYFRDQGKNVMLMMDSVTRFALAQREIGLSVGEPPTTRGYPPSVFALLPRLFERAGTNEKGSITGIYTVLVEGGDMDEPVADAVRGLLDGHIVLSRELAQEGHFPAVNVLASASRLVTEICAQDHITSQMKLREMLAVYDNAKDLIDVGAYQSGANPRLDRAIERMDRIRGFLQQSTAENCPFDETIKQILELVA
jgi:flagellum-specific ATP synthase